MQLFIRAFYLFFCIYIFCRHVQAAQIHSPSNAGQDTPAYNFVNTNAALGVLEPKYYSVGAIRPLVNTKKSFPFSFDWSGYLNNDVTFASRRYQTADYGYAFEIWPYSPIPSINGGDAAAQPQTSVSDLTCRVGVHARGQSIGGFDIEAFLGGSFVQFKIASGIFGFDYMYALLKKNKTWLLFGSYTSPLAIQENLAHTVSYNHAAPFAAWAVYPQILISHESNSKRIYFYAYNEDFFNSPGPEFNYYSLFQGYLASYQRKAVMPNYCLRLEHIGYNFTLGGMVDLKRLVPRSNYKDTLLRHEHILSPIVSSYLWIANDSLSLKTQVYYGANGSDQFMFGGYAVKTGNDDPRIHRTYTNVYFTSGWITLEANKPRNCLLPGIFIGYTKELGAKQQLFKATFPLTDSAQNEFLYQTPLVYSNTTFGSNPLVSPVFGTPFKSINSLLRIAPRLWVYFTPYLALGAEVEISKASYGYLNSYAQAVVEPETVYLLKPLASLQCYF